MNFPAVQQAVQDLEAGHQQFGQALMDLDHDMYKYTLSWTGEEREQFERRRAMWYEKANHISTIVYYAAAFLNSHCDDTGRTEKHNTYAWE